MCAESRLRRNALLAAMLLAAAACPAPAAVPPARATRSAPPAVRALDLARRVDANRINMATSNLGQFAFDLASGSAGLVWPRGTSQTAVFASGLWLGCTVNGEVRVAVAGYGSEFQPGGMVGGTFDDPNRPQHRIYKVARWTGDPADFSHVDRTPAELAADPLLDSLAHHAWSEYMAGAAPYGAPTRTYRLPVNATPAPDDSVDIEGPDVLGDQMLWCVYNDANPVRHQEAEGGTPPLGVEIQQTAFAFDRPNDFGNILFLRFRILNKGANTLENLYLSLWSDPDVGGFTDDLVGCDVPRSLAFAYNGTGIDGIYGTPPPAVGYVLLRGAADPSGGPPLGMTGFSKYVNATDPQAPDEAYYYMQGLFPDGSPVIDPTTGQPTRYFHPGDPVTAQGWLDRKPADRRFLLSSGPTRMLPGESQELWAAIMVGRAADNLSSVGAVRCAADLARGAYQQGFSPLPGPASPCSTQATFVTANCPGPAAFWARECAAGGELLTAQQLDAVAGFVNRQAILFDWPASTREQFCATSDPPGSPDLRQQAKREFAAFLANYSGSQLDLSIGGGDRVWLNPGTSVTCLPLVARTIAELAETVPLASTLHEVVYLDLNSDHRRALTGVLWSGNNNLFFQGAGYAFDFFGSSLDPYDPAMRDSFVTVEVRFSSNPANQQKAYRYLRKHIDDTNDPPGGGRGYHYGGFRDVPFTVWDTENNLQLDAFFIEITDAAADGTILPPGQQRATFDSTWAPSIDGDGAREYLWITKSAYTPAPKPEYEQDGVPVAGTAPVAPMLYSLWARLRQSQDVIDDGDVLRFLWGRPPSPGADSLLVDLESQSLADPAVQQAYQDLVDCLSQINAGVGIGETCSPTTPTLLSLVSAEVTVERVTLRWHIAEAGFAASVERRAEGGDWTAIGNVATDGGGLLVFEDEEVEAGARYEYRLAVVTAGGVAYLGNVRVEVPARYHLAFLGARPNPGDGRLAVWFSLATREPARLEVLDIAGRRVLTRDLAGLAPGSHALDLGESRRLPAGVYLVRIAQGGQHVAGKAAIVR